MIRWIGSIPNEWVAIRAFLALSLAVVGTKFLLSDGMFLLPTWAVMATMMTDMEWGALFLAIAFAAIIARYLGPWPRIVGGFAVCCAHVTLAVLAWMATPEALVPWLLLNIALLAFVSMLRTAARHARQTMLGCAA